MALALVILVFAFSLAILNAGGTHLGLVGACGRLVFLAALVTLPRGRFPPSSVVVVAAGLLGVVPEVLGVALSAGMANRA